MRGAGPFHLPSSLPRICMERMEGQREEGPPLPPPCAAAYTGNTLP